MEDNREQLTVSSSDIPSDVPSDVPLKKDPSPVKPKGCKVHEFMIQLLKKRVQDGKLELERSLRRKKEENMQDQASQTEEEDLKEEKEKMQEQASQTEEEDLKEQKRVLTNEELNKKYLKLLKWCQKTKREIDALLEENQDLTEPKEPCEEVKDVEIDALLKENRDLTEPK
ncbi:hypothetical protein CesoFtcFv8_008327 [Champsocephalus esox]|uniref:Uncharacterized protein n=1 Tax=Champsocephalus esox TaxID=159716 RepID=A0AAN8C7H1_9TELE|nr:hypothetical protein CesoFtcFv8_008327 [Champsocephalus esox]